MNNDLIARLEAATGPHRELDAAIALEIGLPMLNGRIGGVSYRHELCSTPPSFTADINAALTLVPERWSYTVAWLHRNNRAAVAMFHAKLDEQRAEAATPALAICIAALKAKENSNGCGKLDAR